MLLREGGAWEQWPNRHNESAVVNHGRIDLPHHKEEEEEEDGVDVIYFTEA
jgi:hypothetical protein